MVFLATFWRATVGILLLLTVCGIFLEYTFVNNVVRTYYTVLDGLPPGGSVSHVIQPHERRCPASLNMAPEFICYGDQVKPQGARYLTLFTTMTYRPSKLTAFNRTLQMWPLLGQEAKPVLFLAPLNNTDSSDFAPNLRKLASRACHHGWDVLVAPHCNPHNYPVLSSMFRLAQQEYDSTWYGYANADILFNEDVLPTLHFLHDQNSTDVNFLVGKRHNVVIPKDKKVTTLADVTSLMTGIAQGRHDAQDYFFTRKNHFPWSRVPSFVIGMPGFDNWLVWYTHQEKIPAVDISTTNRVLHQSLEGVRSDHATQMKASHLGNFNAKLYGSKVNFRVGFTECTRYMTSYPKGSNRSAHAPQVLVERKFVGRLCQTKSTKIVAKQRQERI